VITVVALAVVVTLVFQASTKAWLARRLELDEPEPMPD
jgi:NhaP-type Na+/H+ or K+/H+ antiporter